MKKAVYLLHMFNPTKNVSPFDVNMAYEGGFDGVIPYTEITTEEVTTLTQDAIFSRGPKGAKMTAIFIGGRDFGLSLEMLRKAKAAMVPPFEISVFVDPSGAITTAAALVAYIERILCTQLSTDLKGKHVSIFGGTGPVGICAATLIEQCGGVTHLVSHRGKSVAETVAREYNSLLGTKLQSASSANPENIQDVLARSDIVIGAAKAGVQVLTKQQIKDAPKIILVADINAVPPAGIEGVQVQDNGLLLQDSDTIRSLGALAIGDLKYKTHRQIFDQIKKSDQPLYCDHLSALSTAQQLVQKIT